MPRHRLPGIGEQVPLFVALPSSLPVERIRTRPRFGSTTLRYKGPNFKVVCFKAWVERLRQPHSSVVVSVSERFTGNHGGAQMDGFFRSRSVALDNASSGEVSQNFVILSRSKRRKELRACRRIPVLCPLRCCIKAFSPECFGRTPCRGVVATGILGILRLALIPAGRDSHGAQNDKSWSALAFPITRDTRSCFPICAHPRKSAAKRFCSSPCLRCGCYSRPVYRMPG